MMIRFALPGVLVLMLGWTGCASHHAPGVTSDYRSQWTTVATDTKSATEAARSVLAARELKDVTAEATRVDGIVKAKTADGTKVTVHVKKVSDTSSRVSVTVGHLGDPKLGADLASQIQMQAEGDQPRTAEPKEPARPSSHVTSSGV